MLQRTYLLITFLSVNVVTENKDFTSIACTTPRQEPGECVGLSSCPTLLRRLNSATRTRDDINYLKNSTCSFERSLAKVCCPLDKITLIEGRSPHSSTNGDLSSSVLNEVLEDPVDVSSSPRLKLLPLSICGPLVEDRIIGGDQVSVMQYPWMALLRCETSFQQVEFNCGGTLINNRYVLTAAHCVTDLLNKKIKSVRLGELHIYNKTDCSTNKKNETLCAPPSEEYIVEEFVVHPNYSKPTKHMNDVALLRLNQTITFKSHIRPICLPIGEEQRRQFATGNMFVAGWGITEKGIRSPHLRRVLLPIVPYENCLQAYSKSQIHISPHRQVCAGGDRKSDSCTGDSGGPLKMFGAVQGDVQRMVQFGIVSFGPKVCADGLPGVYTKVAFYMDWILNTLREKSVRLDELHIYNKTDCITNKKNVTLCAPPFKEYIVEEFVVHPNYSKPTKHINDIALLRLNQTITFKDHIRPICLPIGVEQRRDFSTGKMFVARWGLTEEGIRSPHLLKVLLPVIPYENCVQAYSKKQIQISLSRQVCAGGDHKSDSCAGDSGGPLNIFGTAQSDVQRMVQFGIVSFGPKVCADSLSGVYTKAGFYMDWILNTLRE